MVKLVKQPRIFFPPSKMSCETVLTVLSWLSNLDELHGMHGCPSFPQYIAVNNGNRTEWRLIRAVIIRVINKIGRSRSRRPIISIRSMVNGEIGRHEVLLPINQYYNKICWPLPWIKYDSWVFDRDAQKRNPFQCNCPKHGARKWLYCPITRMKHTLSSYMRDVYTVRPLWARIDAADSHSESKILL